MNKDIRVGDTVKIIGAEDCIADTIGLIGTVTEYTPADKDYDYQVSLPEYCQFITEWGYKENELELEEETK